MSERRDRVPWELLDPDAAPPAGAPARHRRARQGDATVGDKSAAWPSGRSRRSSDAAPWPPDRPLVPPEFAAASWAHRAGRGWPLWGAVVVLLTLGAFVTGRLFRQEADDAPTPPMRAAAVPRATPPASWRAEVAAASSPIAAATRPPAAAARVPVVCLDPGHGGSDLGFTRQGDEALPTLVEKNLALQLAWDVAWQLEQRGIEAVLTRNDDVAVNPRTRDANGDGKTAKDSPSDETLDELQARIDACNAAGADLLVSMHFNGFPDPAARGYEVWYTADRPFGDRSRHAATLLYRELERRMVEAGYTGPPRGVNDDATADVAVEPHAFAAKHYVLTGPAIPGRIRPSEMPGAIVEPLFLSNDEDAFFLKTTAGWVAIATAYEAAIVAYFEDYPDEGGA